MKYFAHIIVSCCILASCNNESKDESSQSKSEEPTAKDSVQVEPEISKIPYDPYLTDLSRVIAGMPIEGNDSVFAEIQASEYYKSYKTFTDETFGKVKANMLEPVKKWCADNSVGTTLEDPTCFYPFSGPDFMFANTFYPEAKNYILLGLERRGSLPHFNEMTENDRIKYFNGLKHSMKYINTRGYFVTQHMGSDFTKADLNGVVHMVLYMMAHTNHKIVKVEDGWIDESGKLNRIAEDDDNPEGTIRVKCVDFVDSAQLTLRSLYFFNKNIADDAIGEGTEIITFIESFKNRVAYLKAAQCAAFNPEFETIRKLVTGSEVVIQDDSGIPYRLLSDSTQFNTKLYGTYNSVISDLKWCLQRDLMRDLNDKGDTRDLPFKISYNGNYGKGIIIFATKTK